MCLRAVGGEVGATSSLAPKIGPLGLVSYAATCVGIYVHTLVHVYIGGQRSDLGFSSRLYK